MARKLIGIRQNTFQAVISGARVPFDPRTTAEVADTRDPENYKALEQPARKARWDIRRQVKSAARLEAAE